MMMNNLINALGGMNPMGLMNQLKANPLPFLRQNGFNVPDNLSNPNEIIQHLMNTGQINQAQYNQARQMAQQYGLR